MDTTPISCKTLGDLFGVDGKRLEVQYALHLSNFLTWDQKPHACDWLLFPENIGSNLSMDETSLSMGELYTIVTNKEAKGKKGALVAIIKGVESQRIICILRKIPTNKRNRVKEITIDLAPTMELIARRSFQKATIVSDRFHVQRLASDAVQEIRIKHRWEAIDQENAERELCKQEGQPFKANIFENGDTLKQLLARSRFLLFKDSRKWTPSQRHRAELLFKHYTDLELAYNLSRSLSDIFSKTKDRLVAFKKLALWYNEVEKAGFKSFNTVSRTIQNNYQHILNYFNERSTNASAESFNAKVKALRNQFRGVRNVDFFLFRLSKIYA
ncbi:MAG: transposase [Bacteroidota bacterium]